MRQSEGTILNPVECAPKPPSFRRKPESRVQSPAQDAHALSRAQVSRHIDHSNRFLKPRIRKDREDTHSTNALPSPRHSGEGRNPEGWWNRSFAREKTIEGWRRAGKVEMIEKGKWCWRDLYEGIIWLDSGFRRNDGPSPSSTSYVPIAPQHEGV